MQTLVPGRDFFRVLDKFFATFALEDAELPAGATLLYLNLFRLAGQRDACAPSQAELARACKSSERTVQLYLRQLVDLGYIRIERTGTHNVYRLLCSTRIRDLSRRAGIDLTEAMPAVSEGEKFSPVAAPIGVNFSPSIRNKRIRHSPPSPVLNLTEQNRPTTPLASSLRMTSPCQGGRVVRDGRGDSLSLPASNSAPHPASRAGDAPSAAPDDRQAPAASGNSATLAFGRDDFERLFAAWPRKQDKLNASRTFAALARAGELPPMAELLATVDRFKAEDRAWRNGFAPNLRFWLQGHRWNDEITPATPATFVKPHATASIPAVPADPVKQARLAAQVRGVQEAIHHARNEENNELTTAVDTLSCLWPEEPRQTLFPRLAMARLRGASVADVVKKALNWSGALPPVAEWFSMAVA